MKLEDFFFDLPDSHVATHPVQPRDSSKLMIVHRNSGEIEHGQFKDVCNYLSERDLLLLNNSKVLPARLHADDGQTELLLIEETSPRHWVAIGRPAKRLRPGTVLDLMPRSSMEGGAPVRPSSGVTGAPPSIKTPVRAEILRSLEDGTRVVRFFGDFDLADYGQLPLPPYIQKARARLDEPDYVSEDDEAYQTVYSRVSGSVAAPTAGLHFTPELLSRIHHDYLTLHVGLGTFRPVKVHDITEHPMHYESYEIPDGLSEKAKAAGRVVAVGTTVCRVIESVPSLKPGPGRTNIFIHPPYSFKRTDALITNFHLPGSTLLMLVAAFMGIDLQRKAYETAIRENYRFYSYGDAMLIL